MADANRRVRVEIGGIVQGVGFRPFVYRLALSHGLGGWVCNTPAGVLLEVQGGTAVVDGFLSSLEAEVPPLAVVTSMLVSELLPGPAEGFAIRPSDSGDRQIEIAPDGDVCADCLQELFNPVDRRYRYPFITCTNCGPRYTIITGVPYDRPLTTMAGFPLCPACLAEYENPADRRFHAQPLACPTCGPQLQMLDATGRAAAAAGEASLQAALGLLRDGRIVAIKGVGGYHLAVDPGNGAAVAELRQRKRRDEKPFALMAADLAAARRLVRLDPLAERLLTGPERPIVILSKRDQGPGTGNREKPVAANVAPANGYFGVMLPSSPLHHLLLHDWGGPLVMTSGNVSDEPIACHEQEAIERLAGIADAYLIHDRAIHTRCDDSVIRVFRGNPLFLRRSRGYVPRAVRLPAPQPAVLAVGAELKGAVCLTRGDRAFLSQHLGDLQNASTLDHLAATVTHLREMLGIEPVAVAHDLHPDYLSTAYAEGIDGLPQLAVQHHHAHLAACLAEHGEEGPAIGVIFDGTGYGPDGTVWGGEFLAGDLAGYERRARFRRVPLPGGDAAVREPFRVALAHLHDALGPAAFDLPHPIVAALSPAEWQVYQQMLARGINSPPTSSCGRLFDAVAALLGLRRIVSYEGQAAIELEALAEQGTASGPYPFVLTDGSGLLEVDFRGMTMALLDDLAAGEAPADLARRFHETLAAATVETCASLAAATGLQRVALSGGVFQNRLLTEGVAAALERRGFTVLVHRLVPPNDGGIALGQAVVAGRRLHKKQ